MTTHAQSDPLDRVSGPDRRRWRKLDREARTILDAQQLRRLRVLAGSPTPVDSFSRLAAPSPRMTVVGLVVGGWRLVGRVPTSASAVLAAAVAAGPVWLAAAGRYGPYWTLTFGGWGAPIAVLANGLVVSRAGGGWGGEMGSPRLQLVG